MVSGANPDDIHIHIHPTSRCAADDDEGARIDYYLRDAKLLPAAAAPRAGLAGFIIRPTLRVPQRRNAYAVENIFLGHGFTKVMHLKGLY